LPINRPHLALVGLMGAGKTSVGALVAECLNYRHVDLDRWVQADTGRSIGVLFEERGEIGFRDAEENSLMRVLELSEPVIISTGGGVLLRRVNRDILARRSYVVWLQVSPEVATGRLGDGSGRPLLQQDGSDGGMVAVLARLMAERDGLYEAAADFVVDTNKKTPSEAAQEILAFLIKVTPSLKTYDPAERSVSQ